MYIKETCIIRGIKEIDKFYPMRAYPKGEKRGIRKRVTSEAQKKVNERRSRKDKERIIKANFERGDLWLTFTYTKEKKPADMDQAKLDRKNLLDKMRKKFRKEGIEFKYICVTEIGERGGVHHHMILKKADSAIAAECWLKGGVHIKHIYSDNLSELAEYMSGGDDKHGVVENWSRSRNLIVPEVIREHIHARSFSNYPKPEKGYYIDDLRSGITAWGYEWQSYKLVPIERKMGKCGKS